MNTKDITEKAPQVQDRLNTIFKMQSDLKRKYDRIEIDNGFQVAQEIPIDLNNAARQQMLKDFAWRVTEELGEAMNCLKNKPWKVTHMATDEAHFKEEIADAFHFFIELCINAGIDSSELFELYFKKNKVNQFRQESKY